MNSGPAGGLGPTSGAAVVSVSDPSQAVNITIMNITVPVPVPVPAGLRFVHPYLPAPLPISSNQTQVTPSSSSSGSSVVSAVSSISGLTHSHSPHHQAPRSHSMTPSPIAGHPNSPYTRDLYRNPSPNINERVSLSLSNSPGGLGMNEYVLNSRGDRPRISLLPAPCSVSSASPTRADYRSNSGSSSRSHSSIQPPQQIQHQDYRPAPSEITSLQDTPPFKKIRLVNPGQQHQQQSQQVPSSQHNAVNVQQQHQIAPVETHVKKNVQLQPLRIDTRPTHGVYTPQTEAISPTLPEPGNQEDAQFKSTKDDLLQQIAKVDREIAKRETQISKLRKKLKELEEAANKPLEAPGLKVEEQTQPKHRSLAQKIYAENRKKAEEAHRLLEKLGPKVKLPLYNQPSDTSIYQDNRKRHQCMKTKLVAKLRKEHADRAALHQQQAQTYATLVQEWHRKVEKLESTQKRKTKEAKNREFFEKIFPELRKQREDKERFNRVGARIKSEADLEEIMDGLQEQEMEDKKMRSYAVIPPLLLDTRQRRLAFQNQNGLLQPEELEAYHSERKLINVWSSMEHELFKEKYLQHPKNFGAIAQAFEHKSAPDCVHHYYLTKKAENYKQMLRKSRRTRSSRNNPNNKVNNSNSTIGPMDILTTGVTTRLQREQQQKTQENPQNSQSLNVSGPPSTSTITSTSTTTNTSTNVTSCTTSSSSNISSNNNSSSINSTSSISTSSTSGSVSSNIRVLNTVSESSSTGISSATTTSTTTTTIASASSVPNTNAVTATLSTTTVTNSTTISSNSAKEAREANKENKDVKDLKFNKEIKEESQSSSETLSSREIKVETKGTLSSSSSTSLANIQTSDKDKKKSNIVSGNSNNSSNNNRNKDKKKEHQNAMETSDEEAQLLDSMELTSGRQIGPHTCTVCQSIVESGSLSRSLSKNQAAKYGLREDQISTGARVCNNCRSKVIRRYKVCPLPGCPNLQGQGNKARIKRLRALPQKWLELPPEIRDPIALEFQIPNNSIKCCSACFNRISRRLSPHLSNDTTDDPDALARSWTDDELEQLKKALRNHGTNWSKVSELIVGKTNHQCKNYYLAYRKKLGLDQIVAEYYQSLGEERRPCLTDEEESGSSTSSCDELAIHDSSDTASAGSPANTISSSTASASAASANINVGLAMQFPQTTDHKTTEKLADVAVSLVPPSPMSTAQAPSGAPPNTREDYDSSATTADEGQGGTDLENSAVVVTLTNPNTSSQAQPKAQPTSQSQSPPSSSNSNPLTVKDLMLGVIEMQLKRNPNSPVSSGTPTITSILKTDHRNDMTYARDYKPLGSMSNSSSTPSSGSSREPILATLSVVSGTHHGRHASPSPQQLPQMQATITPCPPSAPTHHIQQQHPQQQTTIQQESSLPKEGLVVMQAQQAHREIEGTLDLSIKKPRSQQEYNHTAMQPLGSHKPAGHYRPEPPPPPSTYYHGHPHATEQPRAAKSPHVYAASPRPPAPLTPKLSKVSVSVPQTHPKISPKMSAVPAPLKSGSITHGTPVSATRYNEGLLRQMTPPGGTGSQNTSTPSPGSFSSNFYEPPSSVTPENREGPTQNAFMVSASTKEGGSITQGTPVGPYSVDKRATMYDYHRSIRHSPVTTANVPTPPAQNSGVVVSHGQSQYNSVQYPSRRPIQDTRYTMEQLSSRQIIMNDYITSQQMHARSRSVSSTESVSKTESPNNMYCASTPTPPPPSPHAQPRQGVIQRHNTQKHYPPPPPGLEAFSSLVDVAVQQPSLPVPHSQNHPPPTPPSSGSHEGLHMSIERMYSDRYPIDSRTLPGISPRLSRQHAAQYQLAVAMQQREERERDLIMREKEEEHRIQREKEIHHQQQIDQHRLAVQREKEHQEHQQREKDLAEHRLNVQHQHEKDMQQQHYRIFQQREKDIQHQMAAAAAQREKEMIQQQREKEIQQQEMRIAQQKREKEIQQQHAADHRMAVQRERDMAYLQQQQQQHQRYQKHVHQQQRMVEAEIRHAEQTYKDHHPDVQMYRDLADRQCESPSISKSGAFYPPPRIQQAQAQQPPPTSRHNQASNNQGESSTLTAASLIDAIITHQINQSTENNGGNPTQNNQQRAGDRLFQGFHREGTAEPNGIVHSPAAEESNANSSSSNSGAASKIITLGDHIDHVVNKDYAAQISSYRSYPSYPLPDDQWKRRKGSLPDSVKTGDERQIIRVAQQKPQQQQQPQTINKQYRTEPVSPEPTTNHYPRRFYEPTIVTTSSGVPSNKSHLSPLDYVKNKIAEVMRTSEDDKSGPGDRNGGPGDKDEKSRVDSSPGGDMVIDEGPGNQAPVTATTFYPFSALGVHTGPPPAPPPSSSAPVPVVKSEEPAPLLSAQYEPLSDED